ncbi:MAG TPA: RHS repeat protein, partial [Nitrospira sp.]|nr:RHS repeat protein [Nitrospira sp.]
AYDAVNQLLSKTLPGSQVTSYLYDQVGNLTNVSDRDSVLTMTREIWRTASSRASRCRTGRRRPTVTIRPVR